MAANRSHSRVFIVTRAIREAIAGIGFPGGPVATSAALIGFDHPGEWVAVVNDVGDDASIEYAVLSPPGRDEQFTIRVLIHSEVVGRDDVQTEYRLEELAEPVQLLVFDPDALAPVTDPAAYGLTNIRLSSTQMSYGIWPTSEGFAGQAEFRIRVKARI